MKYRKKPVVIDAIQWDGELGTFIEIQKMNKSGLNRKLTADKTGLTIETLEGNHKAKIGDFIIKGVSGELYPCKPDIFEKTYEKVE